MLFDHIAYNIDTEPYGFDKKRSPIGPEMNVFYTKRGSHDSKNAISATLILGKRVP